MNITGRENQQNLVDRSCLFDSKIVEDSRRRCYGELSERGINSRHNLNISLLGSPTPLLTQMPVSSHKYITQITQISQKNHTNITIISHKYHTYITQITQISHKYHTNISLLGSPPLFSHKCQYHRHLQKRIEEEKHSDPRSPLMCF